MADLAQQVQGTKLHRVWIKCRNCGEKQVNVQKPFYNRVLCGVIKTSVQLHSALLLRELQKNRSTEEKEEHIRRDERTKVAAHLAQSLLNGTLENILAGSQTIDGAIIVSPPVLNENYRHPQTATKTTRSSAVIRELPRKRDPTTKERQRLLEADRRRVLYQDGSKQKGSSAKRTLPWHEQTQVAHANPAVAAKPQTKLDQDGFDSRDTWMDSYDDFSSVDEDCPLIRNLAQNHPQLAERGKFTSLDQETPVGKYAHEGGDCETVKKNDAVQPPRRGVGVGVPAPSMIQGSAISSRAIEQLVSILRMPVQRQKVPASALRTAKTMKHAQARFEPPSIDNSNRPLGPASKVGNGHSKNSKNVSSRQLNDNDDAFDQVELSGSSSFAEETDDEDFVQEDPTTQLVEPSIRVTRLAAKHLRPITSNHTDVERASSRINAAITPSNNKGHSVVYPTRMATEQTTAVTRITTSSSNRLSYVVREGITNQSSHTPKRNAENRSQSYTTISHSSGVASSAMPTQRYWLQHGGGKSIDFVDRNASRVEESQRDGTLLRMRYQDDDFPSGSGIVSHHDRAERSGGSVVASRNPGQSAFLPAKRSRSNDYADFVRRPPPDPESQCKLRRYRNVKE